MSEAGGKAARAGLAGRTFWLTRPRNQADTVQGILRERGARVVHMPMLEIEALEYSQAIRSRVLDLDHYAAVIFISTNAAHHGMECIRAYWPQYPVGVRNFAVGPTTAAVLEDYGLSVQYPAGRMSSEALLALPALQELQGRKVLIVRGEGGRETLAEGLREKGADVHYMEVYRRKRPEYDSDWLRDCLRDSPDGIVITSAEALENFAAIFAGCWPRMHRAPLCVSSPRLKETAAALGFRKVRVMPGANDEAIIKSLEKHYG